MDIGDQYTIGGDWGSQTIRRTPRGLTIEYRSSVSGSRTGRVVHVSQSDAQADLGPLAALVMDDETAADIALNLPYRAPSRVLRQGHRVG